VHLSDEDTIVYVKIIVRKCRPNVKLVTYQSKKKIKSGWKK